METNPSGRKTQKGEGRKRAFCADEWGGLVDELLGKKEGPKALDQTFFWKKKEKKRGGARREFS